jgi:hypothetical protein
VTTQEHQHQKTADQRIPDTEVIAVATPAPVFVDSTGRRSRMLRWIALAFGILVLSYGGLASISLAGGPVNSSAVLPLPGLDDDEKADPVPPRPGPAPAAIPSSTPARAPVESTANPARQSTRPAKVSAKPAASKPTPAKTPKKAATTTPPTRSTPTPTVTTTKPTESGTTPPTTGPTTTKAPDPVPPAPAASPVTTKSTTRNQPAALPTLAPAGGDDPADTESSEPSPSGESA